MLTVVRVSSWATEGVLASVILTTWKHVHELLESSPVFVLSCWNPLLVQGQAVAADLMLAKAEMHVLRLWAFLRLANPLSYPKSLKRRAKLQHILLRL